MTPNTTRPSLQALKLASALAALAVSSSVHAADVYFDINGTTAGSGATATGTTAWDTSASAVWSTDATGVSATAVWTNGDSAIFSAGSDAANVRTLTNAGVTVDNLTQQEGRVLINSGTLTLADTAMVVDVQTRVSGDYDLRINSILANSSGGASSITKNGAGILMLTGTNTFSGGFTLNAGTVHLENQASAFGTGTLTLGGGNLVRSFSSTNGALLTIANAISATGTTNLEVINQGNNGDLKFTGAVTGAGTLKFANATVNGFSPKAASIRFESDFSGFTGTIDFTSTGTAASNRLRLGVTGAGQTVDLSGATVTMSGNAGATGTSVLDLNDGASGTVKIGELTGTGGNLTAGFNASTVSSFQVGAKNTSTSFAGRIYDNTSGSTGKAALEKVGTGTLTLTGTNTYTGGTTVTAGTLALGASNVLADTGKIVLNGGVFAIGAGFGDTLGTLDLDANSTLSLGSGGSLVFADSSAQDWASFSLSIVGSFVSGSSIKFGTSSSALTAGQLAQISSSGLTNFGLDGSGFLTASAVPEPSTLAMVAGLGVLGFAAVRRRRRG